MHTREKQPTQGRFTVASLLGGYKKAYKSLLQETHNALTYFQADSGAAVVLYQQIH